MIRLTRQSAVPTTAEIGGQRIAIDKTWSGTGGYLVVRAAHRNDPVYWVREQNGRWASHHTLGEVRADIAWLRARGR